MINCLIAKLAVITAIVSSSTDENLVYVTAEAMATTRLNPGYRAGSF